MVDFTEIDDAGIGTLRVRTVSHPGMGVETAETVGPADEAVAAGSQPISTNILAQGDLAGVGAFLRRGRWRLWRMIRRTALTLDHGSH